MKFVAILVSFIISLSALIATSAEETTDTELRLDRICPYTSYSGNELTYQSLLDSVVTRY
jgi:hypothetical protein